MVRLLHPRRSIGLCLIVLALCASPVMGQTSPPILISQQTSTRAVALEAVTHAREPFPLTSQSILYGTDRRTRIVLFVRNLSLQPGEDLSAIRAQAEDSLGHRYDLRVEYFAPVRGQEWISQIVLRLNDSLGDVGDVLVGLTYGGVTSNRVRVAIGRTGGGPPDDAPLTVLEYDGTPQLVDFGPYWQEDTDLGHFYWEFWAMPGENNYSRYLLSDGYGGAHALLFGFFMANDPQRYSLYGNIYTGSGSVSFNSDEGPSPNEWGHFAVGWDGQYISTYYDGVPVGRTPFAGPRRTPGPAGGGGWLYIGGSDHNNMIGRIAQVRGFEGSNPLADRDGNRRSTSSFVPELFFGLDSFQNTRASFLINFFRPARSVTDFAGARTGTLKGGTDIFALSPPPPLTKFVADPTTPSSPGFGAPTDLVDRPKPPPSEALIFDSFSRRKSTLALYGTGGLNRTEGGSSGPREWRSGGPEETARGATIFGILNGRAVTLSGGPGIAWVQTNSETANLDVRVDRHAGASGSGIQTGLCFRVKDGSNFFFAYTGDSQTDPFTTRTLNVGYWLNGVRTNLATGVNMPDGWTTLRVVTTNVDASKSRITVYADETPVYQTESDLLKNEKGAGLYNDWHGLGLTNRWDNFTVYAAP